MRSSVKHFLDLNRFDTPTLRHILDLGAAFKRGEGDCAAVTGKMLAMIFEKPSTRTRVSFEAGMKQMGGDVIMLAAGDTQLGRGETIADTARVLSRFVDAIMIRTDAQAKLTELAEHASVPVINGLTDESHPCQVMADILTFEEHRGPLAGKVVAWVGDGNNVAASWLHAAGHFGCEIRLACPQSLMPSKAAVEWAKAKGATVVLTTDPAEAATGAQLVMTDTWVSMGCRDKNRHEILSPYQVNDALMAKAAADALFMHCLPAHRGEEVTDSVMDGAQSVVWDEAENRMHVQKGILAWCLS
ncbi:ornithine carbamoyltransferase [Paramagnetospirillum kuznetsovii]|uniref:Ornithine carbamoyltransferase n=1 Tax=Paramagnetospirillum kuznetsovii TaxID=2053833 RepID=A0A364NXI0_9PROT|nr:ornithine carbamoyltransferase [Paramagnetospirillum kuznetsovii]RAU21772.1 ornithine carbamoyltransferase [Paramagnetospirillum kuznetsovii]